MTYMLMHGDADTYIAAVAAFIHPPSLPLFLSVQYCWVPSVP
jgi:hypothetical protein